MWTLRNRLILVNVLIFLLTFIVLVGVLAGQLVGRLVSQLDGELVRASERAVQHIVVYNGGLRLRPDPGLTADLGEDGFVRLLDSQGAVLDGVGAFTDAGVMRESLTTLTGGVMVNQRSNSGELLRVYTRPLFVSAAGDEHGGDDRAGDDRGAAGALAGYVQTGAAPEAALAMVEQIGNSLLIAIPLALAAVVLAGLFATRRALKPLTEMTRSAAAIGADTLAERRLPIPRTRDEVQALALSFNATLERLAAAFDRQRRFTADASHELRTPVTAILGQAELALNRPRTPEVYQETLERIESEAERMQRLIGRMLSLARAESGRQVLTFAPTDVAALLRTLTETLTPQLEEKPVQLRLQAPPSATIVTDADMLTQILLNLLENAIAYTDAGNVDVTLTQQAHGVRIAVADSGPGIDPEHLAQIFEPFFRADPSRQRASGGVGLGLALAHELTHLLGGAITAANRPEGGAVFTVSLPGHPQANVT